MTRMHPCLADREWLHREYVTNGRSATDIGDEIGRTQAVVLRALRQHGIPVRVSGPPRALAGVEDNTIRGAVTGRSVSAAARTLGVTYVTLRTEMDLRGIRHTKHEPDRRRWTRWPQLTDAQWVRGRVAAGWSVRAMAAEVGCKVHEVVSAVDFHGARRPDDGRIWARYPESTARLNDPVWIRRVWVVEGRTVQQIARGLRTSERNVLDALGRAGVDVQAELAARRTARRQARSVAREAEREARRESRAGVPVASLTAANQARTEVAARKVVDAARRVLESGAALSAKDRAVLTARVGHPDLPLSALAVALGMTKDAYASQLRRALRAGREAA